MKTRVIYYLSIVVLICSCSMYDDKTDGDYPESSDGMGQPSSNGNIQAEPGVVTAGEWCDLDKWAFWDSLVRQNDIYATIEKWGMFSLNRIAVRVSSDGNPVVNESVSLKYQGETDWSAKTDNRGTAELFLTDQSKMIADTAALRLEVGGREYPAALFVNDSVNTIELTQSPVVSERIEIGLMVDATGSMGDELEFLKEDLKDVISKIQNVASEAQIFTGVVFYRDEGDEYITDVSPFTSEINTTVSFISKHYAGGGGDFAEAVHTALEVSLSELQWSSSARTRILFMVLDAPPHSEDNVKNSIRRSVATAAEKGVKLIPIVASGIDTDTEFLMRTMALCTNGTYVFITDDSGVGNEHLDPTVGEFQVEKLNDLMVRLVTKYYE